MTENSKSTASSLQQYEANLQRAITFISQNLEKAISLSELAKVSHFSKFHFARLFKAFTGETPGELIRRLRLEKAAYLLIFNVQQPVTEVAFQCGFSSSQNMARAFRLHYDATPLQFRQRYETLPLIERNLSIKKSLGASTPLLHYMDLKEDDQRLYFRLSSNMELASRINIETVPRRQVIYTRETGQYTPERVMNAVGRMATFAGPRNLISEATPLFCVFWDNAATTDESQCRVDCCVESQAGSLPNRFGSQTLAGGKMAFYRCEVHNRDFYAHWNALLRHWLPASGYVLDHRPCVEIYNHLPRPSDSSVHMQIGIPLAN